jgi:hypothetical protein
VVVGEYSPRKSVDAARSSTDGAHALVGSNKSAQCRFHCLDASKVLPQLRFEEDGVAIVAAEPRIAVGLDAAPEVDRRDLLGGVASRCAFRNVGARRFPFRTSSLSVH